jgi:hypothetical protein
MWVWDHRDLPFAGRRLSSMRRRSCLSFCCAGQTWGLCQWTWVQSHEVRACSLELGTQRHLRMQLRAGYLWVGAGRGGTYGFKVQTGNASAQLSVNQRLVVDASSASPGCSGGGPGWTDQVLADGAPEWRMRVPAAVACTTLPGRSNRICLAALVTCRCTACSLLRTSNSCICLSFPSSIHRLSINLSKRHHRVHIAFLLPGCPSTSP